MLPRNLRQEALSRTDVRAIAARAGVVCVDATQDFGIDFYLRVVTYQDRRDSDFGPELDVQLKSTTRAEMNDAEVIYDLEARAYNLLREPRVPGWPRILVLLVLPEDKSQWLTRVDPEAVCLLDFAARVRARDGSQDGTHRCAARERLLPRNAGGASRPDQARR